jgi:hypothetical protein
MSLTSRLSGVITRYEICKAVDRGDISSLFKRPYTSRRLTRFYRDKFIINPLNTAAYRDLDTMQGDARSALEISVQESLDVYDRLLTFTYARLDNRKYFPILKQLVLKGQEQRAQQLIDSGRLSLVDITPDEKRCLQNSVAVYLSEHARQLQISRAMADNRDMAVQVAAIRAVAVHLFLLFAPVREAALSNIDLLTDNDMATIMQTPATVVTVV